MLNYQSHHFNRKVITTKIPKDLDLHIPNKPKWCNLLQTEICNCTETGCLHRRKLNMQNVQKPITCKWLEVHTVHICHAVEWCWNPHIIGFCSHHFIWHLILLRGAHIFYLSNHAVELCWHRFIQRLMLLGCADILSDNSNCWEWCPHHFIPQIMLMGCDDITLSDNLHQNSFWCFVRWRAA